MTRAWCEVHWRGEPILIGRRPTHGLYQKHYSVTGKNAHLGIPVFHDIQFDAERLYNTLHITGCIESTRVRSMLTIWQRMLN